jgi:hypothetical protein
MQQWFIPLSGCYCGLFLSTSTVYAIDWDKIATAFACSAIMLTFGEINRYRERAHRLVDQPNKISTEAQLQRTHEHKEYKMAVKALSACMKQHRIVEMYYQKDSMLREQAKRCIEHASHHVEQSLLMRTTNAKMAYFAPTT